MKFYALTSILLFGFIINRAIRRTNKHENDIMQEFLDREEEANNTPLKSTDDLQPITIGDSLPINIPLKDPSGASLQKTLNSLKSREIINLTYLSNTEVKLTYGTANMERLGNADANYIVMQRSLKKLYALYDAEGYTDEAIALREFELNTGGTDLEAYKYLKEHYFKQNDINSMMTLLKNAEKNTDDRVYNFADSIRKSLELMEIMNGAQNE
ncbi:MAG: hypothetical protein K6F39_04205 [Lachnospiraceae bacterium]|nr:hypothetical protein [Lachnospiraceae bacterium]